MTNVFMQIVQIGGKNEYVAKHSETGQYYVTNYPVNMHIFSSENEAISALKRFDADIGESHRWIDVSDTTFIIKNTLTLEQFQNQDIRNALFPEHRNVAELSVVLETISSAPLTLESGIAGNDWVFVETVGDKFVTSVDGGKHALTENFEDATMFNSPDAARSAACYFGEFEAYFNASTYRIRPNSLITLEDCDGMLRVLRGVDEYKLFVESCRWFGDKLPSAIIIDSAEPNYFNFIPDEMEPTKMSQ